MKLFLYEKKSFSEWKIWGNIGEADMKENIKVSIVIPVYNVEQYLGPCLDSLLSQSLKEIEIIAVDDKSTDNSYVLLKQYEARNPGKIRAFQLDKKGRQGAARNLGIREAKGEYIGFVDSDDYVEADMYETLYRLASELKVDMAYGGYYEDFGSFKKAVSNRSELGKEGSKIKISGKNREDFMCEMRSFWCCLFRSELLREDGVYFPEGLAYEDNYFGVVANYYIKSFAYTDKPLYHYNKSNVGSTTSIRNSAHHLDRMKTADMALEFLKGRDDYAQVHDAVEYIYLELYYIHTVSSIVYYYDKIDYKLIRRVRDKFLKEFPKYKGNRFYAKKFGKMKRIVFRINEWSPHIYANIYKLFRKFSGRGQK